MTTLLFLRIFIKKYVKIEKYVQLILIYVGMFTGIILLSKGVRILQELYCYQKVFVNSTLQL